MHPPKLEQAAIVTERAAWGTLLIMRDLDAFAEFYGRESATILWYLARRTVDPELALDLTAETFAIALSSWEKVRTLAPEQAQAWLFTVARRLVSRYFRRARVERRAVERLGLQVPRLSEDDISLIEARAGLSEIRQAIAAELARLRADQRDAVRLRVVEERSYTDISRQLGISEQTARARVSRGLKALGEALEEFRLLAKEMT